MLSLVPPPPRPSPRRVGSRRHTARRCSRLSSRSRSAALPAVCSSPSYQRARRRCRAVLPRCNWSRELDASKTRQQSTRRHARSATRPSGVRHTSGAPAAPLRLQPAGPRLSVVTIAPPLPPMTLAARLSVFAVVIASRSEVLRTRLLVGRPSVPAATPMGVATAVATHTTLTAVTHTAEMGMAAAPPVAVTHMAVTRTAVTRTAAKHTVAAATPPARRDGALQPPRPVPPPPLPLATLKGGSRPRMLAPLGVHRVLPLPRLRRPR